MTVTPTPIKPHPNGPNKFKVNKTLPAAKEQFPKLLTPNYYLDKIFFVNIKMSIPNYIIKTKPEMTQRDILTAPTTPEKVLNS
jgi:hypothetical protein